ncbi:ABC transporter ATP-binding protein [Aerococcaceae bacterium DSM 111020]|nr:ABC transporter ATP-binding protein [Aerococcaceae bacterium DSM 111020]
MSYIELKNVTKAYQNGDTITKANDQVTFQIEKGEFAVILGPSGAGKSTTLNILGGMDAPTDGEVIVNGEDIAQFNAKQLTTFRRNNIGFVFQNYNLIPNLTAKENVDLSIQISQSDLDAMEVLALCGLDHRADNFPAQLSGGEQQRVSIARAIASEPALLLADEPTGALDNETGIQILKLLRKTCDDLGTTVVVITHNQTISQIADRVIRIRNGKVDSEDLNSDPKDIDAIQW